MKATPFTLRLRTHFLTAQSAIRTRAGWLVRAARDNRDPDDSTPHADAVGFGEATPLPSAGSEDHVTCAGLLDAALAHAQRHGAPPSLPHAPALRHAIALALLDLEARETGEPLARHLAARSAPRREIEVNAVVAAASPDDAAARAGALAKEGYRVLKLKSAAAASCISLVEAVREAVGARVRLRVDANASWSRGDASRILPVLAKHDIEYVEQPLAAHDLAGLAALRARSEVFIAADESASSLERLERVLDAGAADVVVLKPMILGGPDRVLEGAALARERGVRVVVTTTLDGVVAREGALHAAFAAEGDVLACGLDTGRFLVEDLVEGANAPSPARIGLDARRLPGLGLVVPHA